MTTRPQDQDPAAAAVSADRVLAERAADSAVVLAGVLASGMLEHVTRADRLPSMAFDGADPEVVRQIWEAGVAVGYRAGRWSSRPRWDAQALQDAQAALDEAGFAAMAGTVRAAMDCAPSLHPRHPADVEAAAARHHPASAPVPGPRDGAAGGESR